MPYSEEKPYAWQRVPLGSHRPIRVICIGAGYSGQMMPIIAKEKMEKHQVSFQVYEKNNDLGGTWLLNRYPGCQCDIPSHNYAYSFDPKPDWPRYYATSEQIFDYMKDVSAKHGCDNYFAFRHEVVHAAWDDLEGFWRLSVRANGADFEDYCHVLINAAGVLNNWKWPNIPGIERFNGRLMHSADWDITYDYSGQRLGVIGIGSSGIQILPKVAAGASHVDYFVRSHTWVAPTRGINEATEGDPELDEDYNYTPAELERFLQEPEYLQRYRQELADRRIEDFVKGLGNEGSRKKLQEQFAASMASRLGSSAKGRRIAQLITPSFPVGCRRLTPGQGFLEAMAKDNVDTHWDDLGEITESGIRTKDGHFLGLDAILNGINLAEKWDTQDPEAYFGIAVPDMPNYFCFIGPNSPVSNGSLVQAIQMTGVYIYNCISKLQTQGIKSMTVSHEAVRDFNEHSQAWLQDTVWAAPCRSWYKRGIANGRIVGVYSGSCFHFAEALRDPRWEDYDFDYTIPSCPRGKINRFASLGNGLAVREARGGSVGDTQTQNFDSYWNLMVLPEIHH